MYIMSIDGKIWFTEQITPTQLHTYEVNPIYLSKENEIWRDINHFSQIQINDIVFTTSNETIIKKLLLENPDLIKDKDIIEIAEECEDFNDRIINEQLDKDYLNNTLNDPDYYI